MDYKIGQRVQINFNENITGTINGGPFGVWDPDNLRWSTCYSVHLDEGGYVNFYFASTYVSSLVVHEDMLKLLVETNHTKEVRG